MARAQVPDSLLLWRDPAKLGRQEGYLCFFAICPNPHCDDPHLLVEGYVVDDRYLGVVKRGKKHEVLFLPNPEPEPVRRFSFELDTGAGGVRPAQQATGSDDHRAGFEEALARDGALDLLKWVYRAQWNEREVRHAKEVHNIHYGEHAHHRVHAPNSEDRGATPRAEPERPPPVPESKPMSPIGQPASWAAKVGPNERCPCGSGKKYKVCCG